MTKRNDTSAIKAAEELLDFVNSYSVDKQAFAKTICQAHKTLQQSVVRLFMEVVREMAVSENVDDRNQASVELAKKIMTVAEEHPLPFI